MVGRNSAVIGPLGAPAETAGWKVTLTGGDYRGQSQLKKLVLTAETNDRSDAAISSRGNIRVQSHAAHMSGAYLLFL